MMEAPKIITYTMQRGESLDDIASRFDLAESFIQETNNISCDKALSAGDNIRLVIPDESQYYVKNLDAICFRHGKFHEVTLRLNHNFVRIEYKKRSHKTTLPLEGFIELSEEFIGSDPLLPKNFQSDPLYWETSHLQLTFLTDPSKVSSVKTFFLIGPDVYTSIFASEILKMADEVQTSNGFSLPTSPYPHKGKHFPSFIENKKPPPPSHKSLSCPSDPTLPPASSTESLEIDSPKFTITRSQSAAILAPVSFIGETTKVLSDTEVEALRMEFPSRFKSCSWDLVFRLSRDGTSSLSFFRQTQGLEPLLLIIKTKAREKIGAFMSCGMKVSKRYYGSGETFVFKLQPHLETFRWTHDNEFFVSSSDEEITIGGGGASAIWIKGNFLNGFSEACGTFDSPPLTSSLDFKISDMEVWHLRNPRA